MFSRSLLVVLLCIGCALAASASLDIEFKANVNVSGVSNNGWDYRRVSLTTWDAGFARGANYLSVEVQKQTGQVTADIISGAAYVGVGFHPFSYLAYFGSSVDWSFNGSSTDSWITSTNFTAAGGYVGSAYLYLVETTPNGTVVAVQNLKGALIPSATTGVSWSVVDHSTFSADLKYVTLQGSTSASWSVGLTFVASSVAGILNQTDAAVGPKSFESILQVQNYPYASSANSLSLLIGVGTGQASLSGSGHSIISVNGTSQVFFSAAAQVTTENGNVDATVTVTANATEYIDAVDSYFYEQLTAKYGASASYHIVKVTFPAGAANIIYDPTVGAGTPMEDSSTSSSSSFAVKTEVASLFLLFAILLAFL